jgi:hypothetical protein
MVFFPHGHDSSFPPGHLENLAKGEMMAEILQRPFGPLRNFLFALQHLDRKGKGFQTLSPFQLIPIFPISF